MKKEWIIQGQLLSEELVCRARLNKLSYEQVRSRVVNLKQDHERAVSVPKQKPKRKYGYTDEDIEEAVKNGIRKDTFRKRVERGTPVELAKTLKNLR